MSWKSTAGKRKQTAKLRGTATKVSESSWKTGKFNERMKSTGPAEVPQETKATAIIAVAKKEGGGYEAVNVGKDLSPQEREAVSQKTSQEGRQKVRIQKQPSAKAITQAFRREASERRERAGKPPIREGESIRQHYRENPTERKRITFSAAQEATAENTPAARFRIAPSSLPFSEAVQERGSNRWLVFDWTEQKAKQDFSEFIPEAAPRGKYEQAWIEQGWRLQEDFDNFYEKQARTREFWASQPALQGQDFGSKLLVEGFSRLNPFEYVEGAGLMAAQAQWTFSAPWKYRTMAQPKEVWGEIIKMHNPREPSGLLNIGQMALGISELAAYRKSQISPKIEYTVFGKAKNIELPEIVVSRGEASVITNYATATSKEVGQLEFMAVSKGGKYRGTITQRAISRIGEENNRYLVSQEVEVFKVVNKVDWNYEEGFPVFERVGTKEVKVGQSKLIGTGRQTGESVFTKGLEISEVEGKTGVSRRAFYAKHREIVGGDWPVVEQVGFGAEIITQPGWKFEKNILGQSDVFEPAIKPLTKSMKKKWSGAYRAGEDILYLEKGYKQPEAWGDISAENYVYAHEAGHRTMFTANNEFVLKYKQMFKKIPQNKFLKEYAPSFYKGQNFDYYLRFHEYAADTFAVASLGKITTRATTKPFVELWRKYLNIRERAVGQKPLYAVGDVLDYSIEDFTVQRSKLLLTTGEESGQFERSIWGRSGVKLDAGYVEEATPMSIVRKKEEFPDISQPSGEGLILDLESSGGVTKTKGFGFDLAGSQKSISSIIGKAESENTLADLNKVLKPEAKTAKMIPVINTKQSGAAPVNRSNVRLASYNLTTGGMISYNRVSIFGSQEKIFEKSIDKDLEKGISKSENKITGRSIDKSMEKTIDKSLDKSIDKSLEKQADKSLEKGIEKSLLKQIQKTAQHPIKIPTVNPPSLNFEFPGGKGSERGFNVFVRRGGVFKMANIRPLSKKDALNLGSFKVANTAAATFKIKPAGAPVGETFGRRGFWNDLTRYNKGREENLFIEKPSRRIKTWGEKLEITFKGIQANRKW